MRVVGLISGGKDSIFNLMQCISAGHEIVALANIFPDPATKKDELDSFMFQTVGHEGIDAIAEAAGLPLFKETTLGLSKCQSLAYKPTTADEVEDLYRLLSKVKNETSCNAVAVGAIASDYQRSRIENICSRLELTSLCYLWKLDQTKLLRSMIESDVNAITVKVASMGLSPSKHLGKSLSELEETLLKLNEKFGVNVCGEGGEYETYVLDCPLFRQKVVLLDTDVIQDSNADIGASGHLIIKSLNRESKIGNISQTNTLEKCLDEVRNKVPDPNHYVQECCKNIAKNEVPCTQGNFNEANSYQFEVDSTSWFYAHNIAAKNIEDAFIRAKEALARSEMILDDIVSVGLWVRDMGEFATINKKYVECLPGLAPARACVATTLPADQPILLEFVACKKSAEKRKVVHVQSISHWAPANIGPYSQSIRVNGFIFIAGQIPLIPGSMNLLVGPFDHQLRLCLRHTKRILESVGANLDHILQITVFVSNENNITDSINKLRWILPNKNIAIGAVAVTTLPRQAEIEILAVATENKVKSGFMKELIIDGFQCTMDICNSESIVALTCLVKCEDVNDQCNQETINKILQATFNYSKWECGFKIMFSSGIEGLESSIQEAAKDTRITIVPVVGNQSKALFTIVGIGFVIQ